MSLYPITTYQNKLSLLDTQIAIKLAKDTFEQKLANNLNLIRVSAPLFVDPKTGLNDNLSGVEKPVGFHLTAWDQRLEIVQSLAKWKRMALGKYKFDRGCGLYTDMNAIRPDEETDNIHSIYVDQWDWEMTISPENRTVEFLKGIVRKIVLSLAETSQFLRERFPSLTYVLEKEVYFITSEELLQKYPDLNPKEREHKICEEKKTVFIIGIGHKLSHGESHDMRAPDYDDWNLNGDILLWNPVLQCAFELSSMGIRVNKQSLLEQIELSNKSDRLAFAYHQDVVNERLPLTIGGGIGQSRLCQILLEKLHIGEVQVSTWKEEDLEALKKIGAHIL